MLVPLPPPAPPTRRRGRTLPVLLLVVAVCAVATSGVLAGSALAGRDPVPEACCADPVPAGVVVTPSRTPVERPSKLSTCLIGSWRVRGETVTLAFYPGDVRRRFTSSGRAYEFRTDGTVFESATNVTYTSDDGRFRRILNGTREYTWTATDSTISYLSLRRTTMVWQFFDGGRRIDTVPEKVSAPNQAGTYRCSAREVVESSGGYLATWERTGVYGIYA